MAKIDIENILSEMTLEEKAQMCSGRDFWKTQDIPRLQVPSVMMCDGPNGLRKQLGEGDHLGINESIETVCYPTASAIASSFDVNMIYSLGEELGRECQSEDVSMLLGPGVNIKRSPLCGRNFEYFSEDPYLSGKMASSYIQGLQSKGVASCVKHFAANNQETRRMSGSSNLDERTLHEIYLPAFEMAVKEAKVRSVMCAYNAVNGTFCAENKELLEDVLREDWGFDGFVVTDWGAVKDRVKGLMAGLDLEMPGSTSGKETKIIEAVENGQLRMETLDKAVRNILEFVSDCLENNQESATFDREEAHKKSQEFAEQCAILLKNEDQILPLQKNQKVAFIGEFAENPRYQGAGSSHINVKHTVSALECKEDYDITYAKGYDLKSESEDGELLENAVRLAEQSDIAVIFAGLPESFETEGVDRDSLRLPDSQNRLISEIAKVQKNVVVVLHGGSVMALPWFDEVSGVLLMHLGGDRVGAATINLLYGKVNPSGKLAESWPMRLQDNPSYLNFPGENGIVEYREDIFVGYRYYDKKELDVRFPFGYGLSYSKFEYSNLTMSKESVTDEETLVVECDVKNVSDIFGEEVVQLYVGCNGSGIRRPVRELKGFEKIALNPGEQKKVKFTLDQRAFAYYETKIHGWFVESGNYTISIGSSSRDLRLEGIVTMNSNMQLPITYSRVSTIGQLFQSEVGKQIFAEIFAGRKQSEESAKEQESAMGEGSERAHSEMMMAMPLGSLVSYGVVTDAKLDEIIENLNK